MPCVCAVGASAFHGYDVDTCYAVMPDYAVFSLDNEAGRVETVTASDLEAAAALVQAKHPGALTSAVPAEQAAGCNRTKLLWEWMACCQGVQLTTAVHSAASRSASSSAKAFPHSP
jgi:hypothetical protein